MAESLEYYENERDQTERKIEDRETKNAKIKAQITRLKKAYDNLLNIKRNDAKLIINNAKLEKVAGNVQWYGHYKLEFDNIIDNCVSPAANDLYKSIDEVLDEIGRELDKKRGEYDTGCKILNDLNSKWNNLIGIIRNWTN